MGPPPAAPHPDGRSTDDAVIDHQGALVSRRYGDIYFPAGEGDPVHSGLAQARAVFLAGNHLPERFAALRGPMVVGETGFGSGLTFLAAWDLFRRTAPVSARLHFWSVEAHPLSPAVQRHTIQRAPGLGHLAGPLAIAYERTVTLDPRGARRITLDGGRVRLTLVFDDAARALAEHTFWADAWFLDGFAPDANPAMWSDELLLRVAQRCRPGATVATWCAAGHVRRGLQAAGFEMTRRDGYDRKRHMLTGTIDRPLPHSESPRMAPWQLRPRAWDGPRAAAIAGAGIAGATLAHGLRQRGLDVTVFDPIGVARGATAVPLGVLQPRPAPADAMGPAVATAGFCFTTVLLEALVDDWALAHGACGALHPAPTAAAADELRERLHSSGVGPGLGRFVEGAEYWHRLGLGAGDPSAPGGVWFPRACWVEPVSLCQSLLADIEVRPQPVPVPDPGEASELRILACALASANDPAGSHLAMRRVDGQLTVLGDDAQRAPHCILAGAGHLTPAVGGRRVLGATYHRRSAQHLPEGDPPAPTADDDRANLDRMLAAAPHLGWLRGAPILDRWVGVRAAVADGVPLVGPLFDAASFAREHTAQLHGARVAPGDHPALPPTLAAVGFGSRGLVNGPLAAEVIGDLIDGTPLPLSDALAHRLWPARQLARHIARSPH